MKRKIICLFVCMLVIGTFFVITPEVVRGPQDGDYTYTQWGGVATITGYTGAGGAITIPSTLGGYPTVAIGSHAFDSVNGHLVTSVIIPNGVTTIGDYAFNYCTILTSVTIPSSVITISSYAFYFCSNLNPVVIPIGTETIGDLAFSYCTSLISMTIPASVTTIGFDVFTHCPAMTMINVDAANLNYASIDGVLYNKAKTTLIYCPDGKDGTVTLPSSVTTIQTSAFFYCSNLDMINVDAANPNYASESGILYNKAETTLIQCPGGRTAVIIPHTVTTIGDYAFFYCIYMTSVYFSGTLITIGSHAFYYCTHLTSLTIPPSVTTIGNYAFGNCYALASMPIGSGVITIGNNAFASCTSLLSIEFVGLVAPTTVGTNWILNTPVGIRGHAYPTSNLPAPGGVWNGLTMGTINEYTFTLSSGSATITGYLGAGGDITIPSTLFGYTVSEIGASAFDSVNGHLITSAIILGSPCTIDNGAFAHCHSLTSVDISYVGAINDQVFYDCTALTNVIMTFYPSSIGQSAFAYCTSLTTITLPYFLDYLGEGAFYGCSNLRSINIPEGQGLTDLTTIRNHTFDFCTSLASVTINSGVTTIGHSPFSGCGSLTSIIFNGLTAPNTVESDWIQNTPSGIRGHALMSSNFPAPGNYWNGLMMGEASEYTFTVENGQATITGYFGPGGAITIPSTLCGYPTVHIGNSAFYNCDALTSVTIPNSIITIGGSFNDCSNLTSVIIGNSVTTIGAHAFCLSSSLTSLTFLGLVAPTVLNTSHWIHNTSAAIRGHAYTTSNFPPPGSVWNGLTMGDYISVSYDVNHDGIINFQDAGLVWVHRTSLVPYDGLYDVNQDGQVNFQDAGLTWVNRD